MEGAQRVGQVPATGSDELTMAIGTVDLRRYALHRIANLANLDKSLDAVVDFDGGGIADLASVKGAVRMIAIQTVDTPTGTLADCLKVRSTTAFAVQLSALKRTVTLARTSDDTLVGNPASAGSTATDSRMSSRRPTSSSGGRYR